MPEIYQIIIFEEEEDNCEGKAVISNPFKDSERYMKSGKEVIGLILMENLAFGCDHFSAIDIKIGQKRCYHKVSKKRKESQSKVLKATTQGEYSFLL